MKTRVGVISLGCAKNLVDTEVMLGHLDRAGAELVSVPEDADVIVVNTCGFIDAAREESIETILQAARLKEQGRARRLVVAGCMVQRYAGELRRELPEVDAFIGLDELHEIVPRALPGKQLLQISPQAEGGRPEWGPARYLYDDATPRRRSTSPWTAYVKIAEGCDHTCSFCAIPSFRGTFRSRQPESVIREAGLLAQRGVREISLIAQDSSHYGRDLGRKHGLVELLTGLDAVPELRWVRLHYLYPNTCDQRLIDAMAALPRVVKYVDMPLQHADGGVLGRMRRGGDGDRHLVLLERFRRAMPDAALRSTFIVGFPGETDEEFETLLGFVEAARFDHLGVFTYSHERGTAAGELQDDVPAEVKTARKDRLIGLQAGIATQRHRRWIGRRVETVIEGPHPETDLLLAGRMSTQALDVDGQVLINDGTADAGRFVAVEITDVAGYDVVGRIVGAA